MAEISQTDAANPVIEQLEEKDKTSAVAVAGQHAQPLGQHGQQRFHLRGEPQAATLARVVQRTDAGAVARQHQAHQPMPEQGADDGPGKPVSIDQVIGRKPIFAFGNSDGDQQMLQWTAAGPGKRFMGLVHHTDARREWAYDRKSDIGRLDKALDEANSRGWTVVDMATEWRRIYPFDPPATGQVQ